MTREDMKAKLVVLQIENAFYKECMDKHAELVNKLDTLDMTNRSDQLTYLLTMKLSAAYVEMMQLTTEKSYLTDEGESNDN